MKLAVVTGYVVCTVRHEGLAHDKLLMVEMLNARGEPDGQCAVAIDSIGAGCGSGYCWSAELGATGARTRRLSGRSVRDWYRG